MCWLFQSCKKDDIVKPIDSESPSGVYQPINSITEYSDSISFDIGDKHYHFNQTNSIGIGNSQINVKAYNNAIPGRTYATVTAGKFWYGAIDSTMYSAIFGLRSDLNERSTLEIYFNKKFKINELDSAFRTLTPKNQFGVFKIGNQSFAIDYGKENTRDGVVFNLSLSNHFLSSLKPGFSIALQSFKMDIQDNSMFEITKIEHIEGNKYLVEAKFVLNLFDNEERLYRVEKGYMRKNVDMMDNMAGFKL